MDFDNLISKLGEMIGISDLSFDDEGSCSVLFDEDEFFFEKIKDHLVIIAPLGSAENKEDLYREILEANFMGQDCALGSIGINKEQEEFVLTRVFESSLTYERFEESLLIMIKSARKWKTIIKEVRNKSSDRTKVVDKDFTLA